MFDIATDFAIRLTRGDTATLEITFSGDAPEAGDTVLAALKRTAGQRDALLSWTLPRQNDGSYLLRIESADTVGLAVGRYYWDLRVCYSDGQVTTPFAARPFDLTEVVTDLPEAGDAP